MDKPPAIPLKDAPFALPDAGTVPPIAGPAPTGGKVHVYNSYGEPETLNASDLPRALHMGYKVAPEKDVLAAKEEAANLAEFGTGIVPAAEAFGAGALRGATASLSDIGLRHLGVKQETLEKLQKYRPGYSLAGEVAGIAGPALLTGGTSLAAQEAAGAAGLARTAAGYLPSALIAKAGAATVRGVTPGVTRAVGVVANPASRALANKILSQAAATGIGSAVEGAAYGLGQTVSEAELGDPNINAEKIIGSAEIAGGMGFLLGAAGGALSHFTGVKPKAGRAPTVADVVPAEPPIGGLPTTSEVIAGEPAPFAGPPRSIEEIGERLKGATYENMSTELPAKAELQDATGRLPDLRYGPHQIQVDSLVNQQKRDIYKTGIEMQTEEAKILRNHEAVQKAELTNKTDSTIKSIAPEAKLTSDPVLAGNELVDAFKKAAKAEDEAVAPVFKKFDEMAVLPTEPWELVGKIEAAIPGAQKYLDIAEDGAFNLAKYQSKMPFSKAVHGDIQKIVDAANDTALTFGDLRNVRNNVGDHIKFDSSPMDRRLASSLKKNVMDYLQDTVQKFEPDLQLRDAFKRYAINQEKRSTIEYLFGGSLREGAPLSKTMVAEDVLKNVFADSASVDAAKSILGKAEFDKATANFLKSKIAEFTDKGSFSSNKFGSFLRKKGPELEAAFKDNPGALQRIRDLNTVSRILPDSAPINNSQTAKTLTLMGLLKKTGSILHDPKGAIAEGLEHIAKGSERERVYSELNQILASASKEELAHLSGISDLAANVAKATGAANHVSTLANVERSIQKSTRAISQGAAAIFRAQPTPVKKTEKKGWSYNETSEALRSYASNPEKMMDALENHTRAMHGIAPNTVQALQMTAIRATHFLASKLPVEPGHKPLAAKYPPSVSETAKFQKYFDIVKSPMSALAQVKSGTIGTETIEALTAVYPQLYDEMKTEVTDQLTDLIAKGEKIPYQTALSVGFFLGTDLDYSTDQTSIMANQASLAANAANEAAKQSGSSGTSKINASNRMEMPYRAGIERA